MRVDVLLPARDAASTVLAACQGVLADAPAGVDLRLVAVDDASRDATGALLRALAARDARVEVVPGPGQGIVAALQAGLARCSAPYLARMDADDAWLPGRLAAQLAALEADPGLAAVGGEVEIFTDAGPVGEGMRHYGAWLNAHHAPAELHRERFVESPLCHPAVTLRRSALEAAGGYRAGAFPEDYELWLRLLSRGGRLASVARPVLRWRDSGTRLTRTHPAYAPEAHRALKVDYLLREPLAQHPLVICGAGRTGLPLARALQSGGAQVARFVEVHPRKVGTQIQGIPVVGYPDLGPPSDEHLLVAVGAKGARAEIRAWLEARGYVEGEHFTCVA